MTLSPLQVDLIKGDIRQNGIELKDLQDDLLDHICCIMEYEGNQESSFDDIYEKTKKQFFPDGYREIQEQTNFLITQKYNNMKKVMNVIGIVGSAVLMLGSVMKIQSLLGSNEMILLGVIGLTLGYLPMLLIMMLKQSDMLLSKIRNVSGFLGAEAFIIGVFFQVLHLPGGKELLFLGMAIVLMIFLPLLVKSAGADALTKLQPATVSVLLLAIVSTFFAFSNKKTTRFHRENLVSLNANIERSFDEKMERVRTLRRSVDAPEFTNASQDAINYIRGMKQYIVLQLDPANKEKVMDANNVLNDNDALHDIFANQYANHQFNGDELYAKLMKFKTELHKTNPGLSSSLLEMKNKKEWLEEQFVYKEFYNVYSTLSQIELELTTLEMEALSSQD